MAQEDTHVLEMHRTREIESGLERRSKVRSRVPALTVLAHPNPERVGERAFLDDLPLGFEIELSRLSPAFSQPAQKSLGRALADPYLSRKPILLRRGNAHGSVRVVANHSPIETRIDGSTLRSERELGTEDVQEGVVLELGRRVALLLHHLSLPEVYTPERLGLVGDSEAITRLRQDILRVADLEVSVLLRGETGTGKELVARAIHQASRRRGATYLSVNMGAIPGSLATSELFGSVKGAYTGAVQSQIGYFLRAQGGTLFLDEIGESPAEVQVMLLRVLETGEIQRVGSQEPQRVDVRLIAATDANLEQAIEQGTFRETLLHRLSSYEISVPPLRSRRDDFGRLLYHFLHEELEELDESFRLQEPGPNLQPWMPASIVARLVRHDWPGNVRQLRNVARQLVIGSRGLDTVRVGPQVERMLQEVVAGRGSGRAVPAGREGRDERTPTPVPALPKKAKRGSFRKPGDVGAREMLETLRANRWELKPTAEQLGVSRASLYTLVEASADVRKASDLGRQEILDSHERCAGNLDAMVEDLEVSKRGLQMRMKQLGIS